MAGTNLAAQSGLAADKILTVDENGNVGSGKGNEIAGLYPRSGSNTDGEWVQFADGTQICTRTASLDYSFKSSSTFRYRMDGGYVPAFPKPFADEPTLSFSFYGGLDASSESARTTCRPYIMGHTSFGGWSMGGADTLSYTDTVKLFAIGRWK